MMMELVALILGILLVLFAPFLVFRVSRVFHILAILGGLGMAFFAFSLLCEVAQARGVMNALVAAHMYIVPSLFFLFTTTPSVICGEKLRRQKDTKEVK